MNRRQLKARIKNTGRELSGVLLSDDGGVISLVGAGGKTSLMFRLAREASHIDQPIFTSTTTRILSPTKSQSPMLLVAKTAQGLLKMLADLPEVHPHVTLAAKKSPDGNKLIGLHPNEIDALYHHKKSHWIIVEADGANRKPLKAPAGHEPVIPASSTMVIGVIGLKAIDKPLIEKWVFRPTLFAQITGLSLGGPVSIEAVTKLIHHPHGLFKGTPDKARRIVFLNLAGDNGMLNCGLALVDRLKRQPGQIKLAGVIVGHGRDDPGLVANHIFS